MPLAGGCRCGACRYSLDLAGPLKVYACHCLNCQTMSGSAFILQAPVAEPRLVVSGPVEAWRRKARTGVEMTQYFCATCHTRLYSTNDGRPGLALIRAGTLDDSANLAPALHMFTGSKQPWVRLPDGVETFEEGAPAERMPAIFAANFL